MATIRKTNPKIRLASLNGRTIVNVPAREVPEAPMTISFSGLTEAEQRAALAGFPGGRRFRLVREAS